MPSTLHFIVDIENEEFQGVYCSYCGEKITPTQIQDSPGLNFICDCSLAAQELDLIEERDRAEYEISYFKRNLMQNTRTCELTTRIKLHQLQIEAMQKEILDLAALSKSLLS
jgi:hypothetical protein